jgi:OOP family OmpA-OmpF porin
LLTSAAVVAVLGISVSVSRSTSPAQPLVSTTAVATAAPRGYTRPPLPTGAIEPPESPVPMTPFATTPRGEPPPRIAPAATVAFSAESTWIEDAGVFVLEDVYRRLLKNPLARIEVSGHTSADGKDDKNRQMSLLRAMSVKHYLVGQGIDEHRIDVVARGATEPIASNATTEGRTRNRRVEIRFLP